MDAATAAELEVQSLMAVHTLECDADDFSYEINRNGNSNSIADYSEKSNDPPDSIMPVEKKVHQILKQHATATKEFLSAATHSRREKDYVDVLADKLRSLNDIWSQTDGEARLENLCCYGKFREDVQKMVKFFEEQLIISREEANVLYQTTSKEEVNVIYQTSYSTLISFSRLIIPPLLKLLRFVHSLWRDGADFRLPEELKEAKNISGKQICCLLGEPLEYQDHDVEVNELGQWLELIRESGYNCLGLCAPINGAFSELLDSSSINDAILKNLSLMEFRHVTKLIDLVFLPFIKHCPHKLWQEWMLKLLLPLFSYCEDMLYYSWFSLLNDDHANVTYYFGHLCGSEETITKMEDYLLLEFTRKVSKLLGALASPELNSGSFHVSSSGMISASHDWKCTSSSSIVGYILLNDCFRMLSMNLFGWWVDVEATIAVLPFCSALIQVVAATNNEKLRRFAEDDILPALIRRLHDDLPCAIQRTIKKLSYQMNLIYSDEARRDLMVLCQKTYRVCVQSQGLESGDLDNDNTAYGFEDWFEKKKTDLSVKAAWTRPNEFPSLRWTWEFEEEFQRHLPTYLDVLCQVDAMDDCLEWLGDHFTLFEKLSQDFRIRHAINSCTDHRLSMISRILHRKRPAAYYENRSRQMVEWLHKLITVKPYIKLSDTWRSAMRCLKENFDVNLDHFGIDMQHAVDIFFASILRFWEPHFHPLIREGQMDTLLTIARQLVLAKDSEHYKPLDVDLQDFMEHLWPYACFYFYRKKNESGYFTATQQVMIHKRFDGHLSTGVLDSDIYKFSSLKDDFVKKFTDKHIVRSEFAGLSPKLVELSLKERAQFLRRKRQIDTYSKCLKHVMTDGEVKYRLKQLMSKLESEGFFDVNNNSMDWEKRSIHELIDDFKELVFREHCLPRCLVIQGIMDYYEISRRDCTAWQDAFHEIVEVVSYTWRNDLEQIWMDTRFYNGRYYDLLRQPLKKIFTQSIEAPKPKDLNMKRQISKRSSRLRLKRQN